MSRHGLIDAENTSDFLPSHPQQFRKGAFVGEPPLRRAISWRIRQPCTHSQKVGSAAEAWGARLQASSRNKRDLLRKRRKAECMRKARSSTGLFEWNGVHSDVAETVGFEPTDGVNRQTISSRSRYDHFDTSPSFAYSLYQNPGERSRYLCGFWGEKPGGCREA